MKSLILCALGLLPCAWPGFAAVTTTNNGDGSTTLRASYTVPSASVVDVRDDMCRGAGWTTTVVCTQPMVTAAQCAAGQLGTQVTNPETCIQALDRMIKTLLLGLRKAGEIKEAEDAFIKPVREADRSGEIQ